MKAKMGRDPKLQSVVLEGLEEEKEREKGMIRARVRWAELFWCDATADCHVRLPRLERFLPTRQTTN